MREVYLLLQSVNMSNERNHSDGVRRPVGVMHPSSMKSLT